MIHSYEQWPGQCSPTSIKLEHPVRRWASGNAGLILADQCLLVYCYTSDVRDSGGRLAMRVTSRELRDSRPVINMDTAWPYLAGRLRGSTRCLDAYSSGLYLHKIFYLCAEGWAEINLVPGDPETIADFVLRMLAMQVGDRPSRIRLEVALASIDGRYVLVADHSSRTAKTPSLAEQMAGAA